MWRTEDVTGRGRTAQSKDLPVCSGPDVPGRTRGIVTGTLLKNGCLRLSSMPSEGQTPPLPFRNEREDRWTDLRFLRFYHFCVYSCRSYGSNLLSTQSHGGGGRGGCRLELYFLFIYSKTTQVLALALTLPVRCRPRLLGPIVSITQ